MASEVDSRSKHLLGLSRSVNHQKSDWHGVAAPLRHAVTLLCETLHEQMVGMQRMESEVARMRIQLGSVEHSQAALEATLQSQLDACEHDDKRYFNTNPAKVCRDDLEDCIQQVHSRVERIVSEGLASTVGPLQQQCKADSQHTAQLCVRLDALDAQQKKLVARVSKHQKLIGADMLVVQDLQQKVAYVEEASLRTGDAVSTAQACALQVGRQWDAAQQKQTELRQKLDDLATSTEEQIRESSATFDTQLKAIEARTAEAERKGTKDSKQMDVKIAALSASQKRLEQDLCEEQQKRDELVSSSEAHAQTVGSIAAQIQGVSRKVEGLDALERRFKSTEEAVEELKAEAYEQAAGAQRREERQAARIDALETRAAEIPRIIEEANEAAVAGLVAQVSVIGRAAEEASSRAGAADDKARDAAAAAAQSQSAIKGLNTSVTQLIQDIEGFQKQAEGEKGRLDAVEQKQHKLSLSVHTAVAEQMSHVPTTAHVERLLSVQAEKLQIEWRSSHEQMQRQEEQSAAQVHELHKQLTGLQRLAEDLKGAVASAVTPAALQAAITSAVAPLDKELAAARDSSHQVKQRLSDMEGRLQQQLAQLERGADQLKLNIAGAVTPASLEAAVEGVTAAMERGVKEERTISSGLEVRLAGLENKLEAVRTDTVQTLEKRVSAVQSTAERTAAQKVDTEAAALRQQLAALSSNLSGELAGVRESLQEQIDCRCQELSESCRAKAMEQAGQLADQAKQMEPALLKLTQQMEGIQRLCRQELQSVRTALEGKASAEQMMELKTVISEVDKLRSQANSGTSTPRRSVVGSSLRPSGWKM